MNVLHSWLESEQAELSFLTSLESCIRKKRKKKKLIANHFRMLEQKRVPGEKNWKKIRRNQLFSWHPTTEKYPRAAFDPSPSRQLWEVGIPPVPARLSGNIKLLPVQRDADRSVTLLQTRDEENHQRTPPKADDAKDKSTRLK